MQPIERYGLITLLFLVVSAVAFAMWDAEDVVESSSDAPRRAPATAPSSGLQSSATRDAVSTRARTEPGTERSRVANNAPRAADSAALRQAAPTAANELAFNRERSGQSGDSAQRSNAADASRQSALDALARNAEDVIARRRAEPVASPSTVLADRRRTREPRELDVDSTPLGVERESNADSDTKRRDARVGVDLEPRPAAFAKVETYTVKRGEVLGAISQRLYGTSKRVDLIVAANPGLRPDRIYEGQVLNLPSDVELREVAARDRKQPPGEQTASTPAPVPANSPARDVPEGARSYTIAANDSLWKIAANQLGDGSRFKEIAALNPELNPDRLYAGQTIFLPTADAATQVAAVDQPSQTETNSRTKSKVR